jgi:hypothetical protein
MMLELTEVLTLAAELRKGTINRIMAHELVAARARFFARHRLVALPLRAPFLPATADSPLGSAPPSRMLRQPLLLPANNASRRSTN